MNFPPKMKYAVKWLAVILLSAGMMAAASATAEREIIFPEILAIAAGAWFSKKQPWRVSRPQLVLLMTAGAVFGVCAVRFFPVPKLVQTAAAFAFAALLLFFTRTTLVPMLSAAMLPVLLGTTSWVYPVSVFLLCIIIAVIQPVLQDSAPPVKAAGNDGFDRKHEARKWLALFVFFCLTAALPLGTGHLYFIAPPLIVMFAELSNPGGTPRKHVGTVFLLMSSAALAGTVLRYGMELWLHLPLWMVGAVCAALLLLLFTRTKTVFPPAGAAMLLPLLLPANTLWLYPLELSAGCLVFIGASLLLFREKKERVPAKLRSPEES